MSVFGFRGLAAAAVVAGMGAPGWAWSAPHKTTSVGDSISQGALANGSFIPIAHPDLSWSQGTDPRVNSIYSRYLALYPAFTQEPVSVFGAEMVGYADNFAVQVKEVCAQKEVPQHVSVMLGANDVCDRDPSVTSDAAANMYPTALWLEGLRGGLDQLVECMAPGGVVEVMTFPRVDLVWDAGHAKNSFYCPLFWDVVHGCNIITKETDPVRRAAVGAKVNEYNAALASELSVYDSNLNGKNPKGVRFVTDWIGSIEDGFANTSVGSYRLTPEDINSLDCFHPSIVSQAKLACLSWAVNPEGGGDRGACFAAPSPGADAGTDASNTSQEVAP